MSKRRDGDLHAIEMMRSIRDKLRPRLQEMLHEEQREFIEDQLAKTRTGHDKTPQQRSSGGA